MIDHDKPHSADISILQQMSDRMVKMSPEEKARMSRIARGEDGDDLLRREDVRTVIRALRTNPVKSPEYQATLGDVLRAITNLKGIQKGKPS